MKRKIIFILGVCISFSAFGAIANYDDLVSATIRACGEPSIFLSDSFTNEVVNFKAGHTNANERCAADLSLSLALMHRLEEDESCIGSQYCFEIHQSLVSNIVFSAELAQNSWIRYAAGMEYAVGCNFDSRPNDGFQMSTNMLAQISNHSVDMGQTNFWNAMLSLVRCPELPVDAAFRLNAACGLAAQGRWDALAPYTNSLPDSVVETFRHDVE